DPGDDDTHVRTGDRLRLGRLRDDRSLVGDLLRLQPLDDLVDDRAGLELPRAEREVEVVRLLEAGLADHLRERRRAAELRERQVLRLERLLQRLTALLLGSFARLTRVPLADLVPRARALRERQPVARRPAALL